MSKGSSTAAMNQVGTDNSNATAYNGQATGISSQLTPFLQNELTNPQGFGTQALDEMQTQGGQAVSGAEGAAKEQALLNASRTGDSSAVPGIIDNSTRSAMRQQSDNVLGTDIENAKVKLAQQGGAASGLEGMYGTDVAAEMKSLGLANDSINAWTGAKHAATQDMWTDINGIGQLAGSVAGAAVGGG